MDPTQQQGQPPVTIDAVIALLRDDQMRGFRIDVETDSMVEADQTAEKAARTEFVTAVGGFLTQLGPVVKEMPMLAPLVGGMLQFAVKGYKVGQELEELIDKTMQNVSQALANPPPPQPSPDEVLKYKTAELKAGAEGQKVQSEAALGVQEGEQRQIEMKMDLAGKVLDHQHAVSEHQMNQDAMALSAEQQAAAHDQKMEQIAQAAKVAKAKPKDKK